MAVIVAAWRLAQPSLWMVDIVMSEVFGEGGEQYSGLALFLFGIHIFRMVAGTSARLVAGLLERGSGRAPAGG